MMHVELSIIFLALPATALPSSGPGSRSPFIRSRSISKPTGPRGTAFPSQIHAHDFPPPPSHSSPRSNLKRLIIPAAMALSLAGAGGGQCRDRAGVEGSGEGGVPRRGMRNTTAEGNSTQVVFLTQYENIMLGAIGGVLKSYLLMPFVTLKYCLQEGRGFPRNVMEWYRGVVPNAAFMAPITVLQVWSNGYIEKLVTGGERQLTKVEKVSVAVAAGAISAILFSPLDLLVIQQQRLKLGMLATFTHIKNEFGLHKLLRGLKACTIREGIYTGGYLGLAPVMTEMIEKSDLFTLGPVPSGLLGSISAGVIASLITHPVDTAKTVLQADVLGVQYGSTRQAMMEIYSQSGLSSLYRGGIVRCGQVSAAVFVLSTLRRKALEYKAEIERKRIQAIKGEQVELVY